MGEEALFRIALAAGFAAMALIGGRYRLRSNTGESLDRTQEGWVILIGLRLSAALALVVVATYLIAPAALRWAAMGLPDAVRWVGFALAAASAALKIWTFETLGANLTDTVVTRSEHSLVTSGPYRWVRHPFYTSFAADVLGVSALADNWLLLLLGGAALAMIVIRTRKEEENLRLRFGEAYERYERSVGGFLPRLFRDARAD